MNVGYAVSSLILLALFLVTLVAQLAVEALSPVALLDRDPLDQHRRHDDVGLHGPHAGARLREGLADPGHDPARRASPSGGHGEKSLSVDDIRDAQGRALLLDRDPVLEHARAPRSATSWPTTPGSASPAARCSSAALLALIAGRARSSRRISRVVLFWVAFVLTRPFGATFGDVLTKPPRKGGLDLGTIGSSPCCWPSCWPRSPSARVERRGPLSVPPGRSRRRAAGAPGRSRSCRASGAVETPGRSPGTGRRAAAPGPAGRRARSASARSPCPPYRRSRTGRSAG